MNTYPEISIVMPVYKVENYLARAIESVIGQSFSDWELILVDDGSPDCCGDICESYAQRDARIRVIHQANGGLSAARNTGMKYCSGEYLMFIDSDDYIAKNALEIMWNKAQAGDFDIVMAGHRRVEPDGRTPDQSGKWQESTDICQIRKQLLLNILPNFAWGKLYKRAIWEKIQFPRKQLVEDMYAVAQVFYRAERACVCKTPLYYYSHENSKSIMSNPDLTNYIRIRYGRFIGWREHEQLAVKFEPDCVNVCALFALKSAVRAYFLDTEQNALDDNERSEIRDYLLTHQKVQMPVSIRWMGQLIISGHRILIARLGELQRLLVNHQIYRRQKRQMQK